LLGFVALTSGFALLKRTSKVPFRLPEKKPNFL
jgi:hypothetical protein